MRDGVVREWQPPPAWPSELRRVWRVEVGEGHASPVVEDGKAFLSARQGDEEVALAIDLADGKRLWRKAYAAPYVVDPAAADHGKGPKATPAVADGRVFTLGISGLLACWEVETGKRVWHNSFAREFPSTAPQFGTAASPLVDGTSLLVQVGGKDGGALLACDAATGKVRWRVQQADGPSYASPIIAEFDGVRQLVVQTRTTCAGIGLDGDERGKVLWELPFTTAYEQNSVTPVFHRGLLVLGGYDRATTALRVARRSDRWTTEEAWHNDLPLYMSTPVVHDGLLWGMTHRDAGMLFGIDPVDGRTRWSGDGRLADNAAFLSAGEMLLVLTTEAELLVLRPAPDGPTEAARYRVADSPAWAHPVPVEGGVLIKDATHLTRWSWSE
jgi:outer membrane protein assembly factor BamB